MTIIGQIPRKNGDISWNGHHIEKIDLSDFNKRIAYSGSDPFLLDLTIRENLLIGNNSRLNDNDLWDALKLVQADFVSVG